MSQDGSIELEMDWISPVVVLLQGLQENAVC